ncbi:MAG TPA: exodeoxyribonuclease I [Chromatiaceae bacterium]|nr:exodeoxyribonuclease I [Chromatiaceae bacterium]
MTANSFYWHDYETWGSDPRRDRPCQFAGQRTDLDLNPIGPPLVIYARPATDILPQPEACLITGLSPQMAAERGLPEAEFAADIARELGRPGTCGVGYNSLRFDDEVTRHLFYRNLRDPYGREWQNGNSRWDLIDTLRLAHALRPEGINWPTGEDGVASFRLEGLTQANGIEHSGAHDALADVTATIALARLLRHCQPRLFDYSLTLRDKHRVEDLLALGEPLLHCSARYPAALGCIAPVLPVGRHPTQANGVIVFDLRQDPAPLLDLDADAIRARLFTPVAELPEGVSRIPLKTVHVNRAPVLAPLKTLAPEAAERWAIDPDLVQRHAAMLKTAAKAVEAKVRAVHAENGFAPETDPDLMLYGGGFFGPADRREMDRVLTATPEELARNPYRFQDPRLPELLLRLRARNWPETLKPAERDRWETHRRRLLTDPKGGGLTLDAYRQSLARLTVANTGDPARLTILSDLVAWAEKIAPGGD